MKRKREADAATRLWPQWEVRLYGLVCLTVGFIFGLMCR